MAKTQCVLLVLVLLTGNIAFHLEAHCHGAARTSVFRIGIAVVVLRFVDRGRIIPSLHPQLAGAGKSRRRPVPFGRFDGSSLPSAHLALSFWVASPCGHYTGAALRSPDAASGAFRTLGRRSDLA